MKNKFHNYSTLVLIFLIQFTGFSQTPTWNEPIVAGTLCSSGAIDSENNYYFVGETSSRFGNTVFNDSVIFNDTKEAGYTYLAKTDSSYNIKWIKKFESSWTTYDSKIYMDRNNDIIIIGSFYDDIEYDGYTVTEETHTRTIYMAKIDTDGTLIWLTYFPGYE